MRVIAKSISIASNHNKEQGKNQEFSNLRTRSKATKKNRRTRIILRKNLRRRLILRNARKMAELVLPSLNWILIQPLERLKSLINHRDALILNL